MLEVGTSDFTQFLIMKNEDLFVDNRVIQIYYLEICRLPFLVHSNVEIYSQTQFSWASTSQYLEMLNGYFLDQNVSGDSWRYQLHTSSNKTLQRPTHNFQKGQVTCFGDRVGNHESPRFHASTKTTALWDQTYTLTTHTRTHAGTYEYMNIIFPPIFHFFPTTGRFFSPP